MRVEIRLAATLENESIGVNDSQHKNSTFLQCVKQTIQAKNRRKNIMKKIKTAKSFMIRLRLLNLRINQSLSPPTRSAHISQSPDIPCLHSPRQRPDYHPADPPSLPAP